MVFFFLSKLFLGVYIINIFCVDFLGRSYILKLMVFKRSCGWLGGVGVEGSGLDKEWIGVGD